MQELMMSLLLWIGANTGYQIPPEMPKVEMIDIREIRRLAIEIEPRFSKRAFKMMALYKPGSIKLAEEFKPVILIYKGFDPENRVHQAHLLHELVHFLQDVHGKLFRCSAAGESEAYRLERKWLEEQKLAHLYDGPDDVAAFFMSVCNRDD